MGPFAMIVDILQYIKGNQRLTKTSAVVESFSFFDEIFPVKQSFNKEL